MASGSRFRVMVWCLIILVANHELRRAEAGCITDCIPVCYKLGGKNWLQCAIFCAFHCSCHQPWSGIPEASASTDCYAMAQKVLSEIGQLQKLPVTPFEQLANVKPAQAQAQAQAQAEASVINGKNE